MLIPTTFKGVVGRGGLYAQKYSPEILTGVGIVAMGAAAVIGVRATLRLENTVDIAEERIRIVKETRMIALANGHEVQPENAYQRQLYRAYLHNVMTFTKLYGPAISLFVAGAGSVIAGHGIMRKRNVALVAAYNAVEKSFAAYRARVLEDLGAEKDRDYLLGLREEVEEKDGKKEPVVVFDPTKADQFTRCFDESNPKWQRDPGYNQFFLTAQQNYFNNKLVSRGHVFLNEVYDTLGFERTSEGSVVGWILSKDGDNYIDFGIFDATSEAKRNFVNGYEQSIWLNFNHDGVIFDKI